MRRSLCAGIMLTVILLAGSLFAQTISLTAPTSSKTYIEGEEFSTSRVHSPWDMDQLRDIPLDSGFKNPGVKNGIWSATNINTGPMIMPLWKNWGNTSLDQYDAFITEMMPYGGLNPIPASTYTHMSVKLKMTQANRSSFFVYWSQVRLTDPADTASSDTGYFGFTDAEFTGGNNAIKYGTDYIVYNIDLTNGDQFRERNQDLFDNGVSSGSWANYIYGLNIQPSSGAGAGSVLDVDWIRVYDASSSEKLSFKWTTSGASGSDYYVRVYADDNNSGYDGTMIMSGLTNDGQFDMYVSMLPPGEYYFYYQLMFRGASSLDHKAYSGYSAKVTIKNTPQLDIQAPSYTSGVDFAEYETKNGWDCNDSTDFKAIYNTTGSTTYNNGILSATAAGPTGSETESDVRLDLDQQELNEYQRIDCSKYRYCTFRIKVDNPNGLYTNIAYMAEAGWMSRLIWGGSYDISVDGTYSTGIWLYEGWHSYSVDLWDSDLMESSLQGANVAQAGWKEIGTALHFQYDPLEVWFDTPFQLDYIKLCSENKPTSGSYTVRWKTTDSDSTSFTTDLSYGTVDSYGNFTSSGTIATGISHGSGDNTYAWNTSEIAAGEYYIQVSTSDGYKFNKKVSRVPVVISSSSDMREQDYIWALQWGWPGAEPVSGDYDGDGLADFCVFDQNSGLWYAMNAYGEALIWGLAWGWPGAQPVPGDYDGDGVSDQAIYDTNTGAWYVWDQYDQELIYWAITWGFAGTEPVSGDYDGDGKWDLAIFYSTLGTWYIWTTTGGDELYGNEWGWSGANPVVGDFNGDGKYDQALYDGNDGYWYIKDKDDNLIIWGQQWGWTGADTVSGDYNADGTYDMAVFDNPSGSWYILTKDVEVLAWGTQWGWDGAVPVPGDYVKDRNDDMAVFDSNTGYWYVLAK